MVVKIKKNWGFQAFNNNKNVVYLSRNTPVSLEPGKDELLNVLDDLVDETITIIIVAVY